ncbi:hypothetical protein LshimejAT787_0302170 [Lyophyllum shimeji]|uniref:Uncharacterized protein n=1 Tax=Lyophyllum shimeji TaxID=47721 RepID=A0A9P3PI86_LYOSH|nr:hypothetical protein LshimejAT787_0302170 [Lyophyllum shimeji]
MSSTFPSDSSSSRTWWSLTPKQAHLAPQDARRPYSSDRSSRSGGLNSLAAALGFKSKKHPALAIQDPHFSTSRSTAPTPATIDNKFTNRPPSKSVSSTRSRGDSFGPRTPVDIRQDGRQSLLTLSDIDPFAVRALTSPPRTPEFNRLSNYSNSSNPDFVSKGAEPMLDRVSYASSSSHSNFHGSEPSPLSQLTQDMSVSLSPRKPKTKKSTGSLRRKESPVAADQLFGSVWETLPLANKPVMSKSGSSTTLTDMSRLSQPEAAPASRPPMRARGMTDTGPVQRSGFLSSEAAPPSIPATHQSSNSFRTSQTTSPRVIIRQPSVSRIGLPPSAPPRHELPPPPLPPDRRPKADDFEVMVSLSTGSESSSSLSFASSVSSHREVLYSQTYSPRKKERNALERSFSSKAEVEGPGNIFSGAPQPSGARTLKKAVSHQSLGRRAQSANGHTPPPEPPLPAKAPRKQRSFHQSKAPIPVVPPPSLPTSSTGSQLSSPANEVRPASEQRRGSAGGLSLPGRKRLFSGSNGRRPSTSQCIFPDDDSRSTFSVRSDPDESTGIPLFKPTGQPLSPTASTSFWDEPSHEQVPSSPRLAGYEYMPQQILSPEEMAKLEASVEESSSQRRKRGLSILSASTTMTSEAEDESASGGGPSPLSADSANRAANPSLGRSNSLMQKGLTVRLRLSLRPSTSQASMASPSTSEPTTPKSTPTTPSITSLPPPPRRSRPRPAFVPDDAPAIMPLPPPPGRKYVRPKMSFEVALHRRSIMRKPSFLEIDDDTDEKDTDVESPEEPLGGSFLDFARESFDTVRSSSE